MEFHKMLTDELIDIRAVEHAHKNYIISDAIRVELDKRGCFCMDTPTGQEVYHMGSEWINKRKEFIKDIVSINQRFN